MGRRNNKLCDQKGQGPKKIRLEKKLSKRNRKVGQKKHFECTYMVGRKITTKVELQKL